MKLEDMTDIVAPPGSVLVVAVAADMPIEQWRDLRIYMEEAGTRTKLPVLLLPPGVDAHVLQLPPEEDVTDVTPLVDIAPEDDKHDLLAMYREGVMVQWRQCGDVQWIDAHRMLSPIPDHLGSQEIELRRKPK
ncbi:hypothetical protein WDV06_36695 [Streptomyces racemochromogenes]|uniref:Uncharacterized protein n=1 Tax=Streptomyces racemochromogenes TaxID=67353 RepID=A0ABW7PRL9_9ACTN